jgi:hypothetical protein
MNGERILLEVKKFLRSALFYIVLGCVFLWTGYSLSSGTQTHSAFIFIIVILGVALVLYGTGTNASGEGSSGPVKVAIAGAAGVLALVLGFGVVKERDGLVDVFKRQRDYGVIDLSISPDSGVPLDLSSFDVQARLGGRVPLPLWNDNQRVEIFVPIPDDVDGKTEVTVKFTPRPGARIAYPNEIEDVPVNWKSSEVKQTTGFANETIRVFRKVIEPKKPAELKIPTVPEGANLLPQEITIAPQ